MRYIINNNTNPYYNLALEDYLLNEYKTNEDFFILWQNQSSIIVGKNQNTLNEINTDNVEANNVLVARRITGGGAVYHDLGNLNFSFIINTPNDELIDFKKYSLPMIKALNTLGLEVTLSGRNDLLINELKVSGNAQRHASNKVLHHGTLLFDVDIDMMAKVLNVGDEKFISKAAKSIKSRVANMKDYLDSNLSINEFKDLIHNELASADQEIILSTEDIIKIKEKANYFKSWDFVYGISPTFNLENKVKYDWGNTTCQLLVEEGIITTIKISGDYFGSEDTITLQQALTNIPYTKEAIKNVLNSFNLPNYFHGIKEDELLKLIYI